METKHFDIAFMATERLDEHLFLSITPGFEHGPGIQRDGIGPPHMKDPHTVLAVTNSRRLDPTEWGELELPQTTNAYVQRAGTWTLYHHLKAFQENHGRDWRIVGMQSNGDLTMNHWHLAYINPHDGSKKHANLCGLLTQNDPQEPIGLRTYRTLIKWRPEAAKLLGNFYEFLDVKFSPIPNRGWNVKIADSTLAKNYDKIFESLHEYDGRIHDVGPLLEFALSGKMIVEEGVAISLANAIDRFEDVRHVLNLPQVTALGAVNNAIVDSINFGEYQLFRNINERRAALSSPVVIQLQTDNGNVSCNWENVSKKLNERHYTVSKESPTRRGQYRSYPSNKVEIFFQRNVYPFGVLGLRNSKEEKRKQVVGLSSGGMSGQVGNTLEGVTQIMFDFFGCTDAFVLDEGNDVFALTNPLDKNSQNGGYRYSNEEFLERVCVFTRGLVDVDATKARDASATYPLGSELKSWPLNMEIMSELDNDYKNANLSDFRDIVLVSPLRSQVRSVLIFAVAKEATQQI